MEINFLYFLVPFLVITFFLFIYVWIKLKARNKFSAKELQYIKSHWIRIIDSFNHNANQAILDADKLLDYALNKRGFQGTLGEKLKKAKHRFSNINSVWSAHKLRNKIAHELTEINKTEAKSALKNFKKALNDLGANL